MTAAIITLAVVVAAALAAEDRILVVAERDQLAADLARAVAERDIARAGRTPTS